MVPSGCDLEPLTRQGGENKRCTTLKGRLSTTKEKGTVRVAFELLAGFGFPAPFPVHTRS